MSSSKPRAWRLIESGQSEAAWNMALDEALGQSSRGEDAVPTLRLYGWKTQAVTLGRFQDMGDIDLALCDKLGIPVVRRPSGGRAILHGLELTYSFSAPTDRGMFATSLFESYQHLSRAFHDAFRSLGVPVQPHSARRMAGHLRSASCFESASFGEMLVRGRKVIGSAQCRWPGQMGLGPAMLQQGSIPLELDRQRMREVFGASAPDVMAGLREFVPGLLPDELTQAVVRAFSALLGADPLREGPAPEEAALAEGLLQEKYLALDWTQGRRRASRPRQ